MKLGVITDGISQDLEHAFKVMNWYASGEHLKQWSRTDPQGVLGEVYGILACEFDNFKKAIEGK